MSSRVSTNPGVLEAFRALAELAAHAQPVRHQLVHAIGKRWLWRRRLLRGRGLRGLLRERHRRRGAHDRRTQKEKTKTHANAPTEKG
jgi:hypothetical protein